jgi:uncharacterized protein YbcI
MEISENPAPVEAGATAARVSREIVQLHARLFGRGPTKAKAYVGADFVLCVLQEIFTTAERTLIDADRAEHVRATRAAFAEAVSTDFIRIVEDASGRAVRAFVSAVHIDPEFAAELFLLEPSPGGESAGVDGANASGERRIDA